VVVALVVVVVLVASLQLERNTPAFEKEVYFIFNPKKITKKIMSKE
jgi:hypothetical protein